MKIAGTYDEALVVLSVLIAALTSVTALALANRIRASQGWMKAVWMAGASAALGGGIWSMHFIAMLAFTLPGMAMSYDVGLTLFSLTLAIGFTAAGFAIVGARGDNLASLILAGLLMGCGIVAMHYVGMAAMEMGAAVTYDPIWVSISVLIAVAAATIALWLASRDRMASYQFGASVLMGFAISGMHYAGMRAATFEAHQHVNHANNSVVLSQGHLALWVGAITGLIMTFSLGAARVERAFREYDRREARIALRLKVADILRAQDTSAALDEIAALMGEHFGVSRTGFGQLDPHENVFDCDVCWTYGNVPKLLGRLPASAFGGKIVAALMRGETVVVDDLLASEMSDEERTRDTARDVDTRAILVVPFVRDGRLRTIVYLNDRNRRHWLRDDIQFLEELAERTRLVIEREVVESQLRELNATLEARVEARSAELKEMQLALQQSQKMEAVGQLVSGLAHDFNNLLGAVIGSLDIIKRKADDPARVTKFAEVGLQAAERGAKLTSQLLAFSRSGRIELRPVIVCDVIGEIRDLLSRTLGPLIEIEYDLNPRPIPVTSDPTQIEMIVLNLAINARDAMPGGGKLTIGTSVREIANDAELSDGAYVEICVTDTGTGMDEETARRAIEPFFTTKGVGKGTGLGLAQVYGSARQAGGTLRIKSRPGEGTTMSIFLKCVALTSSAGSGAAAGLGHEVPVQSAVALGRILLVDDDEDLRGVLRGSLEELGYKVREASNGPAALQIMSSCSPDAMVIDFAMPGMNGVELANAVRKLKSNMPIVLATGCADENALANIDQRSIKLLHKPFRVEVLLEALVATVSEIGSTNVEAAD